MTGLFHHQCHNAHHSKHRQNNVIKLMNVGKNETVTLKLRENRDINQRMETKVPTSWALLLRSVPPNHSKSDETNIYLRIIHPRNLTWNPKTEVWKRVFLFMLVFGGVYDIAWYIFHKLDLTPSHYASHQHHVLSWGFQHKPSFTTGILVRGRSNLRYTVLYIEGVAFKSSLRIFVPLNLHFNLAQSSWWKKSPNNHLGCIKPYK